MMEELKKLRELTEELTGNGYLRDQADEWEYALDAMPEFVFIINTQYVIKFINSSLSNALGVKSKDVLFDKKVFDVLQLDESFIVNSIGISKQGKEIFLTAFNKWFLCYFEPIKAGGGIIIGYICFLINITDRKKAESEIADNNVRLQSLVDILQRRFDSTQSFLDYTLGIAIKITNSRFGYIYYYDEDTKEFNLNSWSKDVMAECSMPNPPTCYELHKTGVWGEAVRQRKVIIINDFNSDNPLKKGYPEGHVILNKFMTVPIFNNNKIVAVVGVANKNTDYNEADSLQLTLIMDVVWKVVDRRLVSERLDNLIVRHGALIDAVPDIVVEVDMNRIYTWVNKAGKEFFGNDVVGKEASFYFVGEQTTYEKTQDLFDGNEKIVYVESYQIRCDGKKRLLAWWCRSINTTDGVVGVISSARDITDNRHFEQTLAESEARYRELYDNAPTGIYEIDLVSGKLLSVNDAVCRYTGYSREELLNMNVFDILTDDSKLVFKQNLEDCALGKQMPVSIEYHVRSKNGVEFWMLANIRYEYNDNSIPTSAHVIAHDMTERKSMETELLLARENVVNAEIEVKNKLLKLTIEKNKNKKVLVVDDEPDVCKLIGIHLSNEGYEVFCAHDGESAIESVVVNKPDMVLLDLGLKNSRLCGQEVVEKIKSMDDNLPIIIVSGTTYVNDINNALKAGAWDYICKPILIWNDLIHIVKRNLEHSRLIRKSIIFNEYLQATIG